LRKKLGRQKGEKSTPRIAKREGEHVVREKRMSQNKNGRKKPHEKWEKDPEYTNAVRPRPHPKQITQSRGNVEGNKNGGRNPTKLQSRSSARHRTPKKTPTEKKAATKSAKSLSTEENRRDSHQCRRSWWWVVEGVDEGGEPVEARRPTLKSLKRPKKKGFSYQKRQAYEEGKRGYEKRKKERVTANGY